MSETQQKPRRKKRGPTDDWDAVLDVECHTRDEDGNLVPCNRNPVVQAIGEKLRGTIRSDSMNTDRVNGIIAAVGQIPGHRIYVDLEGMHVKIVDRMTLPENRQLDERLRKMARQSQDVRLGGDWEYRWKSGNDTPQGDHDIGFASKKQWAYCLWCLRRMLDENKLKLVTGALPSLGEIKKIHDIHVNSHGYNFMINGKPWNVIDDEKMEEITRLEEFAGA